MADSPPPFDLHAYEPPISLWAEVEKHVHPHEREEIKNVLGASLVAQSLELHDEINLLLDIWRDYREETFDTADEQQQQSLPEPPAARERLKQEICFFVENLRERAQREGRNPDKSLQSHNARVIDYALERPGSAGFSRPSTASSSRDGRETPMTRRSNSSSERMSIGSSVSEEVESMSDKLNYLKLEEVVQHLRDTMVEEVDQLLSDISFLQSCLDDEANFRSESRMTCTQPTLTDLREERNKLEKELTDVPTYSNQTEQAMRRMSFGGLVPNSAGKVRPIQHPSSAGTGARGSPKRAAPMKASHDLVSPTPGGSKPQPPAARPREKTNSANKTPKPAATAASRASTTTSHKGQSSARAASTTRGEIEALAPAHVTIRAGKGKPSSSKDSSSLFKVASVPASSVKENGDVLLHTPSPPQPPPSSSKSPHHRPGSASRFRNMVLSCRDSS